MKKKIAGLPNAEYITPTKEDLERRFKEYNDKYFDGVLPPCKFTVVRMKNHSTATYFIKEQKIRIAKNVYWTNETLKLTLIHEMVHHYVKTRLNYTPNFFSHGRRYRKVCRMLRKKHGLRVNLYELPLAHWKGEKKPTLLKEVMYHFITLILPF